MTKEEFDRIARQRPFVPVEVRMVDGTRIIFRALEQFLVSRSAIFTLDPEGNALSYNLLLVRSVRHRPELASKGNGASRRRPRQ